MSICIFAIFPHPPPLIIRKNGRAMALEKKVGRANPGEDDGVCVTIGSETDREMVKN